MPVQPHDSKFYQPETQTGVVRVFQSDEVTPKPLAGYAFRLELRKDERSKAADWTITTTPGDRGQLTVDEEAGTIAWTLLLPDAEPMRSYDRKLIRTRAADSNEKVWWDGKHQVMPRFDAGAAGGDGAPARAEVVDIAVYDDPEEVRLIVRDLDPALPVRTALDAGRIIGVDESGAFITADLYRPTIAELQTAKGLRVGATVFAGGNLAVGDGGGGIFQAVSSSGLSADSIRYYTTTTTGVYLQRLLERDRRITFAMAGIREGSQSQAQRQANFARYQAGVTTVAALSGTFFAPSGTWQIEVPPSTPVVFVGTQERGAVMPAGTKLTLEGEAGTTLDLYPKEVGFSMTLLLVPHSSEAYFRRFRLAGPTVPSAYTYVDPVNGETVYATNATAHQRNNMDGDTHPGAFYSTNAFMHYCAPGQAHTRSKIVFEDVHVDGLFMNALAATGGTYEVHAERSKFETWWQCFALYNGEGNDVRLTATGCDFMNTSFRHGVGSRWGGHAIYAHPNISLWLEGNRFPTGRYYALQHYSSSGGGASSTAEYVHIVGNVDDTYQGWMLTNAPKTRVYFARNAVASNVQPGASTLIEGGTIGGDIALSEVQIAANSRIEIRKVVLNDGRIALSDPARSLRLVIDGVEQTFVNAGYANHLNMCAGYSIELRNFKTNVTIAAGHAMWELGFVRHDIEKGLIEGTGDAFRFVEPVVRNGSGAPTSNPVTEKPYARLKGIDFRQTGKNTWCHSADDHFLTVEDWDDRRAGGARSSTGFDFTNGATGFGRVQAHILIPKGRTCPVETPSAATLTLPRGYDTYPISGSAAITAIRFENFGSPSHLSGRTAVGEITLKSVSTGAGWTLPVGGTTIHAKSAAARPAREVARLVMENLRMVGTESAVAGEALNPLYGAPNGTLKVFEGHLAQTEVKRKTLSIVQKDSGGTTVATLTDDGLGSLFDTSGNFAGRVWYVNGRYSLYRSAAPAAGSSFTASYTRLASVTAAGDIVEV